MSAVLSVWSALACAGGVRLGDVEWVDFSYGEALDNTQGCKLTVNGEDLDALSLLRMGNVLRVNNELGDVYEYLINNAQIDRLTPGTPILGVPVEKLLDDVFVQSLVSGRRSTIVDDALSAASWVSQYAVPSLAAYGQPWWSPGTVDVLATSSWKFVDQTVMYLVRQILTNRTEVLRARRNGEVGYFLDLVNLSRAQTPLADVGGNVVAFSHQIDDTQQANIIVIAGELVSGNDEPERLWMVPFRVASLAGAVATLDDPSGQGTTILGSDGQPFISTLAPLTSGLNWRLGAITPPVLWNNGLARFLARAVYVQSAKMLWGVFRNPGGSTGGLKSLNIETRSQGSLLTTSLTDPRDAAYNAATGVLAVVDLGGNRVTPYTLSGPTAGTPVAVGTGPRRIVRLTDTGFDQYLVGHSGSDAVKQLSPSTLAVSATSPAMTKPAHLAPVSKTQVYAASDTADAVYRYNASANTLTTTITGGIAPTWYPIAFPVQPFGYGAIVYIPATQEVWACQHAITIALPTPYSGITIIDATTDTIVTRLDTSATHGEITDARTLNGDFYGVTADGFLVKYSGTDYTLQWIRRHAAWPVNTNYLIAEALWALHSIEYLPDVDCFAIGDDNGIVYFMDAQTGGAAIARALTAAVAATPSVTLANSVFPLRQYDEAFFTRDDGLPLTEIPNEASVLTYGPKQRPEPESTLAGGQLSGGTNRVLNGDLTWFDSSRKAARFLNLSLPDATSEAKWDGYTDNAVRTFTAVANGSQGSTAYTPMSLVLKTAGAGRVFQPGDILDGGTITFMVLAKATADGSGNVTLWAAPSNVAGVVDGSTITVTRPNALTLLAAAPSLVVLPQLLFGGGSPTGCFSTIAADVNLPFIPGEMTNLYWGMTAFAFGINGNANMWLVEVRGPDQSVLESVPPDLLNVHPNPDQTSLATVLGGNNLAAMSFTGSIPLPPHCAGGHTQLRIGPGVLPQGPWIMALYLAKLWIQVSNADRGVPDLSAWDAWQLAQDTGVDRGEPFVNYTVQPKEDDPTNPFRLGGDVLLRDAEEGVAATPRVVQIVRTLPRTPDEVVLPLITLDNRDPSLIKRLVEMGAF